MKKLKEEEKMLDLRMFKYVEVGEFFLYKSRVYEKIRDTGYYFVISNSKGIDNRWVLVPVDAIVEVV